MLNRARTASYPTLPVGMRWCGIDRAASTHALTPHSRRPSAERAPTWDPDGPQCWPHSSRSAAGAHCPVAWRGKARLPSARRSSAEAAATRRCRQAAARALRERGRQAAAAAAAGQAEALGLRWRLDDAARANTVRAGRRAGARAWPHLAGERGPDARAACPGRPCLQTGRGAQLSTKRSPLGAEEKIMGKKRRLVPAGPAAGAGAERRKARRRGWRRARRGRGCCGRGACARGARGGGARQAGAAARAPERARP